MGTGSELNLLGRMIKEDNAIVDGSYNLAKTILTGSQITQKFASKTQRTRVD